MAKQQEEREKIRRRLQNIV